MLNSDQITHVHFITDSIVQQQKQHKH